MTAVDAATDTVDRVVADLVADPGGNLYPSVYETGRLVSLAPWLAGHEQRIEFLRSAQQPDGTWSGPGTLALVPTLSAVEALLAAGRPGDSVERGLAAAADLLRQVERDGLPGTLIPFLIGPALVADINDRLGHERLALPPDLDPAALAALRADGWRNPVSAFYLEIVGPAAVGSTAVSPVAGVIGCSAAATAAWLGPEAPAADDPRAESVDFLVRSQSTMDGPVAGLTSMTYFERAWAYRALAAAGTDPEVIAPLLDGLPGDVGRTGAPSAPGAAADSESAALVLLAEADRTGVLPEPHCLWEYDRDTHFLTTVPVGAPSVITNARVLEVLHRYRQQGPPDADRYAEAATRVARYLTDNQQPDGSWRDRWHISPYYATVSCGLALLAAGIAEPVGRAAAMVRETQRSDGSWGVHEGTAEETAYAVLLLAAAPGEHQDAIARGVAHLERTGSAGPHPPLWVGKDLYAPVNLIRAAVLAAAEAGRRAGERRACPYPFQPAERLETDLRAAELRREAPVSRVALPYGGEGWLAVGHREVRGVLSDRRFSRAALVGADVPRVTPRVIAQTSILTMDPPDHARLRRLVAPAFTPRRIEALRPRAARLAVDLVGRMIDQGPPADLVRDLARPLPSTLMSELLGVPAADQDRFFDWAETVVGGPGVDPSEIAAAFAELSEYLAGLVAQRREEPRDDLIGTLVAARDVGDRLSEQELVGIGVTLLLAGLETTTNQIGNFAWHLLTRPDRMAWLREDLGRVPTAVEELLRFTPIATSAGFTRVATEDVRLGGVTIRAGEAVLVDLDSANRDEAIYPDADELRLDRAGEPHLAFGHGPHFCLGAQLARMELAVALTALLEALPGLRLDVPAEELAWHTDRVVRGLRELPVRW
ncbi:cytochrome P450 [Saccharopolyspora hattusasensis]|uniref:cytochrome P450 n=1 Tax=Saccharopolyspora hattusasensis TaxID=1128679 RepID=UPI003D96AFF5